MNKPIYKKWWFWVVLPVLLIIILFIIFGITMSLDPNFQKKMSDLDKLEEFNKRREKNQNERMLRKDSIQQAQAIFESENKDSIALSKALEEINNFNYTEYIADKSSIYDAIKLFESMGEHYKVQIIQLAKLSEVLYISMK